MNEELFDVGLQAKIIALMVKDRGFLTRNSRFIKPSYFESEMLMDFCNIINNYFSEYGNVIPIPILLREVTALLDKTPRPNPTEYVKFVKAIGKDVLVEREYIKNYIKDFIQLQEHKIALDLSIDHLRKKEYNKIHELFARAKTAGTDFKSGMFYFDEEAINNRYKEDNSIKTGTGWEEMDRCFGGGLEAGELGIILGGTNVGKTKELVQIGCNNLRQRKKVVHFSMEMKQNKIGLRYDRNLLGKNLTAINDDFDSAKKFLLQFAKNLKANLYIKEFPTRSATVDDLKMEVDYLRSFGFDPDLGLVDYAAIMKPKRQRDGRHQEIEETVEDLRGLGGELGFPFWTVAQAKPSALNKAIIDMDELRESFGQGTTAEIIYALCQTKEEYEQNILRKYICKNRDAKKHQVFRYRTNDDLMVMRYEPE